MFIGPKSERSKEEEEQTEWQQGALTGALLPLPLAGRSRRRKGQSDAASHQTEAFPDTAADTSRGCAVSLSERHFTPPQLEVGAHTADRINIMDPQWKKNPENNLQSQRQPVPP